MGERLSVSCLAIHPRLGLIQGNHMCGGRSVDEAHATYMAISYLTGEPQLLTYLSEFGWLFTTEDEAVIVGISDKRQIISAIQELSTMERQFEMWSASDPNSVINPWEVYEWITSDSGFDFDKSHSEIVFSTNIDNDIIDLSNILADTIRDMERKGVVDLLDPRLKILQSDAYRILDDIAGLDR
jgi:hypothetical protein